MNDVGTGTGIAAVQRQLRGVGTVSYTHLDVYKRQESDRAKRNRELVKRDNNNVFDFLESEGYIRLKADACTSSKELYEVYKMWCEENSLNAIKALSLIHI